MVDVTPNSARVEAATSSSSALEQTGDAVFESLWRRVDEAWDDLKTHNAFLEYALQAERLPDAAARYRALRDDPMRGELAKKRLGAIVLAAESLLASAARAEPYRVPWYITALVGLVSAAVLLWVVRLVFGR